MLDTYNVVLADAARNLKMNIKNSPVLYILFSIMILFSLVMIVMLTYFFIQNVDES